MDRHVGVTHVVVEAAGDTKILGYYTLVTRTIDRDITPAAIVREREKPFDPGPIAEGLSMIGDRDKNKARATISMVEGKARSPDHVPQLSVPEKTKELDL